MATLSNAQYILIIIKAARRINRKLCLFGTADEIVIDPATGEMTSPDPDENGDLYDMVLLQAECMITTREFQEELRESSGGVLVKDGEQTTDTRGVGLARGTFFDSDYSPCAELKDWIFIEKMNRSGGGKMVW